MNEFVVGVDGSDDCRMALRWAAAATDAAGDRVRAVQSRVHPRSVSQECVEYASCPVVVVRTERTSAMAT